MRVLTDWGPMSVVSVSVSVSVSSVAVAVAVAVAVSVCVCGQEAVACKPVLFDLALNKAFYPGPLPSSFLPHAQHQRPFKPRRAQRHKKNFKHWLCFFCV
eukprot:2959664-Rhodomonas_salina.1